MAKLTTEDKKEIVMLRLEEGISLKELSIRFGIRQDNIKKLVNKYKIHGEKIFEKSHKTLTPEIKLEIISRCINGESKNSLAIEYLITEAQIIEWLKRYEENGYNGLRNKPKGRPSAMRKKKIEDESLTETERLIKGSFEGLDCACGGVDDKMKIFVTDASVIDRVREFVAEKTHLNFVAFDVVAIDSIPMNESGKTLYSELK